MVSEQSKAAFLRTIDRHKHDSQRSPAERQDVAEADVSTLQRPAPPCHHSPSSDLPPGSLAAMAGNHKNGEGGARDH